MLVTYIFLVIALKNLANNIRKTILCFNALHFIKQKCVILPIFKFKGNNLCMNKTWESLTIMIYSVARMKLGINFCTNPK